MSDLLAELSGRGLVAQTTEPELDRELAKLRAQGVPMAAYCGFDPTADSLHVGHFMGIRALMYAQRHGLRPIAVVGGATGMIGDPSGRTAERSLLTKQSVAENVAGLRRLLGKFLDFNHATAPAMIVNNLDWIGAMSAVDYLRDVGKHFRLGAMLAKDSVRSRMEQNDEGLSYTEFSYQLLQAYDFAHLHREHRCVLQLGGSDQWGNITAGIDLIRKTAPDDALPAFGLTLPIITDSAGKKFGKSEGNAVWLSADRTSAYDFYQFWLRVEDADVARYLRLFTFIPLDEIVRIEIEHAKDPGSRSAQRRLAETMTELVHGRGALSRVRDTSEILFGGEITGVDRHTLEEVFSQVPTFQLPGDRLAAGWPATDAVVETGLAKSKGDARRLISQGGFYVNNRPWKDSAAAITPESLAADGLLVLRTGKKNYLLVRVGQP